MDGTAPRLDLNAAALAALCDEVRDLILRHHAGLPDAFVGQSEGGAALAEAMREPEAAAGPTPAPELLAVVEQALSVTYNTASGGYLAYVPGGGLPAAAVGDLLASALNRYVGVWRAAPGLVELEQNVIRRFAEIVGYRTGADQTAHGILTSGGSLANFSAVVTAREALLGRDIRHGVLYTSAEAHHSVQKAAQLAGIFEDRVRIVPPGADLRLDPVALERVVAEDRGQGLVPFCTVAQAGSTNTGVVDDLDALADVCVAHRMWFHVDAAYGGFFAMTERGRAALRGLSRADSVTLDPHKGLFLPYGTGCLLVKEDGPLQRAHDVAAAYMPAMADGAEHIDFCAISPELSRRARGLPVWLALRLHGLDAFRAALDEKMDLARRLHDGIVARPWLETVTPPTLSLLSFQVKAEDPDAATERLLQTVNSYGRVFLTGTRIASHGYVGRACVLHLRTTARHIDMCLSDLDRAHAELA